MPQFKQLFPRHLDIEQNPFGSAKTTVLRTFFKQRFLVSSGETLIPIPTSEIAYFYAQDRWTYLITRSNKRFLVDYKLRDLEFLLDPNDFFRLNRSYLIQMNSVLNLKPHLKGQLTVRLVPEVDEKVIVSRTKTPEFKKWLTR